MVPTLHLSAANLVLGQVRQLRHLWAIGAFDIQIIVDFDQRLRSHELNRTCASFRTLASFYEKYLFFLVQSVMHFSQKRSPHPVHSLGDLTTFVQMGQSNMSPDKLGKRSLS